MHVGRRFVDTGMHAVLVCHHHFATFAIAIALCSGLLPSAGAAVGFFETFGAEGTVGPIWIIIRVGVWAADLAVGLPRLARKALGIQAHFTIGAGVTMVGGAGITTTKSRVPVVAFVSALVVVLDHGAGSTPRHPTVSGILW